MAWALMIFFIFITAIFLIIALLFPEWVGITGKKALEIQKHQTEETGKDVTASEDTAKAVNESSKNSGNS